MDMPTIIKGLRNNECLSCGKGPMFYESGQGDFAGKHYVSCSFCSTRWEIDQVTTDEYVRIMDTKHHKRLHGQI